MQDVVILSAKRTPIGSFMGGLAPLPAPRLGARAIAAAIEAAGVDAATIQHVIMGNVLQAGIGQAPARQAAIYAGLPQSTGATTLHKVCGSGMRAIMDASNAIRAEEWDFMVAGGMESMSNAPHLLEGSRNGYRMGAVTVSDAMIKDGLWDPYGDKHMGNCAETCAREYGFTRDQQDAHALESYKRAQQAITDNLFASELVAVEVPQRKQAALIIDRDEEPFAAPLDKMGKLRPAFDSSEHGTITAANASKINDGAAALVLASAAAAKQAGAKPLARIVAYASHAQQPEWFTTAPAQAAKKALQRAGLNAGQIDAWEINEAFAVVSMAAIRDLELDATRVNSRGGAIALGHPIGMSGARIVGTLLHTLVDERKRYGCAAICIGGGEATAIIIENLRL